MLGLLTALLLVQTPEIDRLKSECERNLDACRLLDAAQKQYEAEQDTKRKEEERIRAADREANTRHREAVEAADQAQAEANEAALRKKCGKDFGRVRVGMTWKRVRQCAGVDLEWSTKAEDERGIIYECENGAVRVEGGKVVRWVAY